jgi:hypothetical protein
MSPTLFFRSPPGTHPATGGLIETLQRKLTALGFDTKGIDGVYGRDTEQAIRAWQTQAGLAADGRVSEQAWQAITQTAVPSLRERALQITADFEGTGFSKVCGNFDDAWLTWGIVGFTLYNGELKQLLLQIRQTHPATFSAAFTTLEDDLIEILNGPRAEQLAWANDISRGPKKYDVRDDWKQCFKRLGAAAEVRAMQLAWTEHKYFARAEKDLAKFPIKGERAYALMFDVAVQNGGVTAEEEAEIKDWIQANPGAPQQELLKAIAKIEAVNSKAYADVLSRKMALATGKGAVHGSDYFIDAWGVRS